MLALPKRNRHLATHFLVLPPDSELLGRSSPNSTKIYIPQCPWWPSILPPTFQWHPRTSLQKISHIGGNGAGKQSTQAPIGTSEHGTPGHGVKRSGRPDSKRGLELKMVESKPRASRGKQGERVAVVLTTRIRAWPFLRSTAILIVFVIKKSSYGNNTAAYWAQVDIKNYSHCYKCSSFLAPDFFCCFGVSNCSLHLAQFIE